jgi:hypothetical protein
MTLNGKEENSEEDFCPNYVQEFGLSMSFDACFRPGAIETLGKHVTRSDVLPVTSSSYRLVKL